MFVPVNMTKCYANIFKSEFDKFLSKLPNNPCTANVDNSMAGTVLKQSWCLQRNGLAD